MTITTELEKLPYVHPITTGIYLVSGPDGSRFPHGNGFLLCGDRTVLIDTGIGAERIEAIDNILRIDSLVISHPHPDHILAWHALADRELLLPAQTDESVNDLRTLGRRFVEGDEDAAYWTWVAENRLGLHPLRTPDRRFDDGQVLDFGTVQLQAIRVPGHLIDHYCFLERNTKTLFSTDVDFTGFGPWYGNPEGDPALLLRNVTMLRQLPFEIVCSSHQHPIAAADADRAFDDFLAKFNRQQEQVLDLCRQGMDLAAMLRASPFYRNRLFDSTLQRIFESQMIRKNLALLIADEQVVEKGGRYLVAD